MKKHLDTGTEQLQSYWWH